MCFFCLVPLNDHSLSLNEVYYCKDFSIRFKKYLFLFVSAFVLLGEIKNWGVEALDDPCVFIYNSRNYTRLIAIGSYTLFSKSTIVEIIQGL